jgi:ectoine hydroxylase-related dioxygenase (phytanoyl-CoA dioxygenase family)
MTAAKMNAYRRYPGFAQTELRSSVDEHVENLRLVGYSVLKRAIPASAASKLAARLDELWAEQDAEFGRGRLEAMGERGTHRGLMAADKRFIDLALNPKVLAVVDAMVGPTAILNLQNASAAFPGVRHFQSAFHRDFAKDFVATKCLSVNAFWCVTDFTVENGATEIVPGTHRLEKFPSESYIERNKLAITAPAGSIIFWDSLLLHRTGFNRTKKARYGINHMYTRPFIKQQMDLPVFLKGLVDVESRAGQVLGFWTIPPKSVREFRVDDPSKRTYRAGQG